MFCDNCGKQVPDGHRFCSHCGHAMTAPEQQFQPPVQEQQFVPPVQQHQPPVQQYQPPVQQYQPPVQQYQPPVQQYQPPVQQYQQPYYQPQQPAFEVSMPAGSKGVRKKGKKGKGGLIVAAVLLVALVAAVVLFWNQLSGLALRSFGTPGQYLTFVESKNADDALEGVCDAYGTALENLEKAGKPSVQASVKLRPGQTIITLLETALAQEGVTLELDWLREVSLDADVTTDASKQAADLVLGINGTGVLTARTVQDLEAMQVFLALPELNETWLMGNFADSGVDVSQTQKLPGELAKALPREEVLEEILDAYIDIIIAHLGDAEKRTETVSVAGVEQKLTVLRVELSQRELVDLVDALLQHANKDEKLMTVLDDMSEVVNTMPEAYEQVDLRQEFRQIVTEGMSSVVDARPEATDETAVILDTYVDDAHRIVGRDIIVPEEDTLHYLLAVSGTGYAFEAWAGDSSVTGKGQLSKGGVSGSFTVTVEGEQLLEVQVEGLQAKDGRLYGTLHLLPNSELMEDGSDIGAILGGNLSFTISLEGDGTDLSVLAGGSELLGVNVQGKETERRPVSLPSGIDMEDDTAVEQWAKGLKLDTLVKNLEMAGVPSELTEVVSALGQLLAY